MTRTNPYELGLDKNAANFVALSPVSFVERSAEVFGDLPAVIHGARRYSWAQVRERATIGDRTVIGAMNSPAER